MFGWFKKVEKASIPPAEAAEVELEFKAKLQQAESLGKDIESAVQAMKQSRQARMTRRQRLITIPDPEPT